LTSEAEFRKAESMRNIAAREAHRKEIITLLFEKNMRRGAAAKQRVIERMRRAV
jgi:hypothetical protein